MHKTLNIKEGMTIPYVFFFAASGRRPHGAWGTSQGWTGSRIYQDLLVTSKCSSGSAPKAPKDRVSVPFSGKIFYSQPWFFRDPNHADASFPRFHAYPEGDQNSSISSWSSLRFSQVDPTNSAHHPPWKSGKTSTLFCGMPTTKRLGSQFQELHVAPISNSIVKTSIKKNKQAKLK